MIKTTTLTLTVACLLFAGGIARGELYESGKLLPTGEDPFDLRFDRFGDSVSTYGGTALIGAWQDHGPDPFIHGGSAYLFDVATGQQLFKLRGSDSQFLDKFGFSVAVGGEHALVGAPEHWGGVEQSGAAYIFSTTTGQELLKLTASDRDEDDSFGCDVSLDGVRAVIGARYDSDIARDAGAAYVFDLTTGQELLKLIASDTSARDFFGCSVAVSGDRAIVGAWGDGPGHSTGSAYVFDVTTGQELLKLTASDATGGDHFGSSVAIHGNRAVVGADANDDAGPYTGSAYVFDMTTGQQLFKLMDPDPYEYEHFGHSVAISDDVVVVGRYYGADGSRIHVFDLQTGQLLYSLAAGDDGYLNYGVGRSIVAIDGHTILAGDAFDDEVARAAGAAYVFRLPGDSGDFDGDGDVDADDIDLLCDNLGTPEGGYDLDGDGDVDADDVTFLVEGLVELQDGSGRVGTMRGDFDLDGLVNATDLAIMKTGFGHSGLGYADGNANADDVVNATDLAILKTNFGFEAPTGAVPEPVTMGLLGLSSLTLLRRKR